MTDSDSRALDLLTLGEIRGSAEGRRLLDLALGTDAAAREARERLDVSEAVVDLWRQSRERSADRERRAIAGWKSLGARAAAGESDALAELLTLARFLVRERVPKRGNLDHAMVEAVSAALGSAIARARPKATKRPRRSEVSFALSEESFRSTGTILHPEGRKRHLLTAREMAGRLRDIPREEAMPNRTAAARIAAAQDQLRKITGRLKAEAEALRAVARELRAEPDPGPLPLLGYLAGGIEDDAGEVEYVIRSILVDADGDLEADYRSAQESAA